ncbi:unnamed protein product [Heligmosomoides polygyrus]|uniref:Uncharacterized protein n=1 Tax=Heligmosomoides polygyrus TaxID=6339 RepID=A0A3P7YHB4_HELPZ|nr:unnamed protein product [Heligmosomoides polygyrus]
MLKGNLYRTVVRQALLYGSECWALGKAKEWQLHAAEMRMLRFRGTRKASERSPKERWKDVIKRDLNEVGATADDALDRMRWRQITRTAEPATARN